ncbi:MAG: DUF3267 domain-containing protein [Clostridiaceae bacterium]
MMKSKLDVNKFEIIDKTFSLKKANIIGIIILIPMFITFFLIYHSLYSNKVDSYNILHAVIIVILGIIAHEFIHGFVWHFYCEEKWKNIKFGFDKKTLSPITSCSEVLPINGYRLGTLSPFLITGVLPYIIGLTLNNATLVYASILLMCSAAGDFMILFTIMKEKGSSLVIDHETLCGCTVYRKKST